MITSIWQTASVLATWSIIYRHTVLSISSSLTLLMLKSVYFSMSLGSLDCWLWIRVGGDFLSRLASFVVSVWPGRKKGAAEYYRSYKNAGLCRTGFGFPGHPVLNYSLKAAAQVVEFVWIDWEAERVVAKTLELFVPLQFIQIKRPISWTLGDTYCMAVPVFDTVTRGLVGTWSVLVNVIF